MYPRIKTLSSNGKDYQYLVVSESYRNKKGTSTTRDIANFGNISKIDNAKVEKLIKGLMKLFDINSFKLNSDIKIIESLEHGSIILWQHFWNKLGLGNIISKCISKDKKHVSIDVAKYVEMMVVSRNSTPMSKLGTTRWKKRTSYKYMKGYENLPNEVEYYYRAMDYLLPFKEDIEFAIFEKLKDLFSVNVKMTFYDITSTYFHSNNCPISKLGYSRDTRPDLEQIVVGVVTSSEGYPIKHYVFDGNTKDESTVADVIKDLKEKFNIEDTTFVGDRGMISKLNIDTIIKEDFSYIMGVKFRQDEIMDMLFDNIDNLWKDYDIYKNLKIQEKTLNVKNFIVWKVINILEENEMEYTEESIQKLKIFITKLTNKSCIKKEKNKENSLFQNLTAGNSKVKRRISYLLGKYEGKYDNKRRVVVCLNEERQKATRIKRNKKIKKISEELINILEKDKKKIKKNDSEKSLESKILNIFSGYKRQYKKFYNLKDNLNGKSCEIILNSEIITKTEKQDGIFILNTNLSEIVIKKEKIIDSYKNLREVEDLFDDFKNFVDVNPVRHWKENRVRAHVFICILSLLLKRVFEIDSYKSKAVMTSLEEISKLKLILCQVNDEETFKTITVPSSTQSNIFKLVGIKNPISLHKFL